VTKGAALVSGYSDAAAPSLSSRNRGALRRHPTSIAIRMKARGPHWQSPRSAGPRGPCADAPRDSL